MKANELMIGDWILVSSKPYQIEYIELYEDEYRAILKNTCSFVTESEFEPIPLTKEILEKNFEKIGDADYKISGLWRIWKNPNYGFIIATLVIDDFGGGSYEPCIPCKYVHKLQHFLSLIDLEKEIIL